MSMEKAVKLLWNCASELSTQTHAERLLKSHYINTSRKLVKHNIQLPEDTIGPARMCTRCGNQWPDGNYQLHLQPQRLANNAKRRRLIAQLDTMKAKKQRGILSRGAQKRAKWLKKRMVSNIAVDCKLCGHKTKLPLEKPKKRIKSSNIETMATKRTTTAATTTTAASVLVKEKKNKSKNKNKDVNAGLKLPIPSQKQQPKAPTAQNATPTKALKTTTATTKSNSANTATKKQKQKQKSKAAQSSSAPTAVPKVQSKTQKQNALLQLAAQLKAHAAKNANKTQQNPLQAFLK